jgi:hypothetical protein
VITYRRWAKEGHRRGEEVLHCGHCCEQRRRTSPTRQSRRRGSSTRAATSITGTRPSAGWVSLGSGRRSCAARVRPVLSLLSRPLDVRRFRCGLRRSAEERPSSSCGRI